MRKGWRLAALLAGIVLLGILAPSVALAEEREEAHSPDAVLSATVASLRGDSEGLELTGAPLYDCGLDESGRVYSFTLGGSEGFAVLLRRGGDYEVEELYFDAANPYAGVRCPVYAGFMKYLGYEAGTFRDLLSGLPVYGWDRFGGNTYSHSGSLELTYSRRALASDTVAGYLPMYTRCSYPNSCAPIAGSVVIGYFDRYFETLIPGYSAYANGAYRGQTEATQAVADDLYFRMRTNVNGGTSYADFVAGLRSYAAAKSRTLTTSSVLSGGALNMSAVRGAVAADRPVVLFLRGYNVSEFWGEGGGRDYVVSDYYAGNHVMVAGGYREISYYRTEAVRKWSPVWYNPFRFVTENEERNFRSDAYLKVSAVVPGYTDGYIRLGDGESIPYAFSVAVK